MDISAHPARRFTFYLHQQQQQQKLNIFKLYYLSSFRIAFGITESNGEFSAGDVELSGSVTREEAAKRCKSSRNLL
jgi:hypothetical protein